MGEEEEQGASDLDQMEDEDADNDELQGEMENLLSAGIIRGNLSSTLKEVNDELTREKKGPSTKMLADLNDPQ